MSDVAIEDARAREAAADAPQGDGASPDAAVQPIGDGATEAAVDSGSCAVLTAGPEGPRAARSGGYTGDLDAYSALYNVVCTGLSECVSSCTAAGGTTASCTEGSECVDGSSGKHCLPPTYWRYTDQALLEDGTSMSGYAEQTLVAIKYQDPIVLSDFRLQVPANAKIRGVQFDVRRSVLTEGSAVDDSIRILRGGKPVGVDHKKEGARWSSTFGYVTYGGPNDTWGESWTAADLGDSGFGLSIAARYTDTAGNDRAYVDYVRATVHYTTANCP